MSVKRPPFKSGLGISTGDVVTTSYGTGPYEVWDIWGPRYFHDDGLHIVVRDYPVVSLTLVQAGTTPRKGDIDHRWINDIRRDGDRWFTGTNDEVFVERVASSAAPMQVALFPPVEQLPERYRFQDGVDYDAGYGSVWRCEHCEMDFNGERSGVHGRGPAHCPVCGWFGEDILVMRLTERVVAA